MLRRLGRFLSPDEYDAIPVRIMNHVGRQVGRPPVLLVTPPARKATDLEHEKRIRAHLGYSILDEAARDTLDVWMTERAARGLLADELVREAEEYLRLRRIVIPARSTLERMATRAATRTESDLLGTINERLTAEQRMAIDHLLDVPGHRSQLFALKQYPPEPTPTAINSYLQRAELLCDLGVGQIDLSGVRPEIVLHHAELVRRYDVDDLKRFKPAKCHALVACFLVEANKSVLDHLVEMHHVFTTGLHRRARNAYEKKQRELRQKSGRNLRLVLDALEALLDEDPEHVEQLDLDAVRGAIVGCRELQRLTERGEFEALRLRHHTLKRYLPGFLRLAFEGGPGTEPLIEAIEHARALHDEGTTDLGEDPPTEFATGLWKRGLARKLDVRSWELALAYAIRDALRSGDLYLADSRHHVSFWNLVQGPEQWAAARARAYREMGLPAEPGHALERLRTEFDAALHDFRDGLPDNRFAKVEAGALHLSRRDALDIPDRVQDLKRAIDTHMPRIRIEDLLLEVDRWTGFTAELTAPSGYSERSAALRYPTLLAALVAHGTNLGTATMAQSTKDITVDMLQRTSKWCLRAEALKAANRVLVDYHHGLPFADVWGDGTRSSSDGQRFGVQTSSLLAGFYPRYFGFYERAITVYTHVSDQSAVFAARAISCSPREAIYVLDGLLENDTVLRPREHYTDTHGCTEQLFGLCYLLGFSFMPRLKDLKDQQLYMLDREHVAGDLRGLFRSAIDVELVREQWDQLVRVASSLRDRTAPAHVVLDRLAASSRSDRLARALTMLGRVVKTTFILRYIHDSAVRDRIHLQLNRAESRHALARRLFFANQGSFRTGDYAEIMNKVSALSVLSNSVLLWNTRQLERVVGALEGADGNHVDRDDLARISPLLHAHVIPSGTYRFGV